MPIRPVLLILLPFFSLKIAAQLSFSAEMEGDLSKQLNTGAGVHGGLLYGRNSHFQWGLKAGVVQLNDMRKHYFPLTLVGQYRITNNEMMDPYVAIEAGRGFYNDPRYNITGDICGYVGLGIKFNPENRVPVYTGAGVSAFGFSNPTYHSYSKRLTFRLGVEF